MSDKTYTIKSISNLSGLSELVIRAWETRYHVVTPDRTKGNRRLYSEEDLEKLSLLKKITDNGHRIGSIATLDLEQLQRIRNKQEFNDLSEVKGRTLDLLPQSLIDCIEAIKEFDGKKLENILMDASLLLSQPKLIESFILPLMGKVGIFWREGILRVSHEHFASTIIRKFLLTLSDGYNINSNAPKLIVTTSQGQYHEVGALIGSAYAASDGWKVIYLGASLPAEEIAFVLNETEASAVLLNFIYPHDDPSIRSEMNKLRELVGAIPVIVTGSAVESYRKIFEENNMTVLNDSESFRQELLNLREVKAGEV
ncbi:MAG: MerR family transcriptional regulator [Bacteroidetes bacterium]|nr:MerR family transcriptional regulator [Bacteroidota bacterium]